ncbi:MAG: DUF4407 domain-containing protein [Bacteroides sp.]|nr:DUF4407 domain-containing protein [Bacteroides sp.]
MATNNSQQDINSFTRTLWWIAGATPKILEKYPSEYAKFSAIGMTIVMTCLVAFVSGMSAAWYFSSKLLVAIAFGAFWALMIFCIDRALVVTMKKSIHSKSFKEKLIEALKILIPRAILAILVALLMSIPLELIVFEDVINAELPNYQSKKLEDSSKIGYDAARKSEAEEREKRLNRQNESAQKNLDYADNAYASAHKAVTELEYQINTKRGQMDRPNSSRYNSAFNDLQKSKAALKSSDISDAARSALRARISSSQAIMNEEKTKWNVRLREEINALEPKLKNARAEEKKKAADQAEARKATVDIGKMVHEVQTAISQADKQIGQQVTAVDSRQKNTNKFILHYSVLEYVVYDKTVEKVPITRIKQSANIDSNGPAEVEEEETEYEEVWHYRNRDALMLLWLIRILFFVFEMMPTVVKAVSKPGPYERECEAQDEQMAQFFTSVTYRNHMQTMLNDRLQHEKQLAEDRRNTEKILHDDILSKIKDAQKDVALDAISKWRTSQMNGNVSGNSSPSVSPAPPQAHNLNSSPSQPNKASTMSPPQAPAPNVPNTTTTSTDEFE